MVRVGEKVQLSVEGGSIIPAGFHTVSRVNPDGSFHVGGNTSVWPRRIILAHKKG